MPFTVTSLLIVLVLGISAAVSAAEPDPADTACLGCHADVAEDRHGHPLGIHRDGAPSCTDCHRDPGDHPLQRPGTMMTFTAEPPQARSQVCLGCHESAHGEPGASVHAQAGVGCDGCHQAHRSADEAALPLATALADFHEPDRASATCIGCHEAVFARFAFNERHRLGEGALSCVSCHDPHGSPTRALLGDAGESRCASCHRAAAGPFVFEHAASRVDGCVACHEPHGSPNRHLLNHQRVGEQCHTCHAVVPQFHIGFAPGAPARFDQDTVCTNCHTAIHGSNFDRNFLR